MTRDERGSATLFAAAGLFLLLTLAILVVHVGAAIATRHRAQSAADLAALAAAAAATSGTAGACAAADAIANHMHVTVRTCTLDGWDAELTVETHIDLVAFGSRHVTAAAKAGPRD